MNILDVYSTNHFQIEVKTAKNTYKQETLRRSSATICKMLRNSSVTSKPSLFFLFLGFTLTREPQTPNLTLFTAISLHYQQS